MSGKTTLIIPWPLVKDNELNIHNADLYIYIFFSFPENKVLMSLNGCEPDALLALPDPSLADDQYKTLTTLSDFYDRELVGTIGWAKQIPGKEICDAFCLGLRHGLQLQRIWRTRIRIETAHELKAKGSKTMKNRLWGCVISGALLLENIQRR